MTSKTVDTLFKDNKLSVITFKAADAQFAIPLDQVLFIEKDVNQNLQQNNLGEAGNEGIDFQNQTVHLQDFNQLVGSESPHRAMQKFVKALNSMEEDAISRACLEIEQGDREKALHSLTSELETKQAGLRELFDRAREQTTDNERPIIVFVEHTGGQVTALRLDNISDVASYNQSHFYADESSKGLLKKSPDFKVEGYLRRGKEAPLILINCKPDPKAAFQYPDLT